MNSRLALTITCTVALGVLLGDHGGLAVAADKLELQPCTLPGVNNARCGTCEVWENRATQTGRRFGLRVVVLPAAGPERAADPIVYLAGGPGDSATQGAAGLAMEFKSLLTRRDLLLVDQRGTGGSHPLDCLLFGPPEDLQSYLGDFVPLDAVKRCRPELEKTADLTLYTTSIAADDLEEVRQALGYEKLNLIGGSYGTRAALVFLRRHPASVRTAILMGVAPPTDPMPASFPRDAQRALDGVVSECAADAACHAAFPELSTEVRGVFDRLARERVAVEILHPLTGEMARVTLHHDLAAEAVRYLMYQSGTASSIPAILHQAAQGDFTPLAEFALFGRQRIVALGAWGMYLSVTCAEDLPLIKPGEGERLAQGTFLGDYRLRQQRAACEAWARADIPADFANPVGAKAPVLLVTGQWDPATPPSAADATARHLPNSLSLIVPSGGHSLDGLEGLDCIQGLVTRFVENGSVAGLDTSCVAKIRRPGFVISLPSSKPVAVAPEALARLAGRYVAADASFEVLIEAAGNKLRATLSAGATFLLVPVSATRFRVAGGQGLAILFETDPGGTRQIAIEEGGIVTFRLIRATR